MRSSGLDYLKFVMAIMVIGIHCASIGYHSELWGVLTAQGLFRIAVPVFFIINGYYLYDSIRKGKATTVVGQLFGLFCCWQLAYLYFYYELAFTDPTEFLLTLLVGYHHLWYLSSLVVAVIAVYFIRRASSARLLCCAVALYLFGVFLQYGSNYQWFPLQQGHLFYRSAIFLGLPFVLIGFLLKREQIRPLPYAGGWAVLAVLLLMLEALLNYQLHQQVMGYDLPLTALIAGPLVFLWASSLNVVHSPHSRWFAQTATLIYLLHPWFNYLFHLADVPQGSLAKYAGSVLGSLLMAAIYLQLRKTLASRAPLLSQ